MALVKKNVQAVTDTAEAHTESGTLNVLYKPSMITQEMVRKAQAEGDASAILPCIVDWDFYDIPPTTDEGTGEVLDLGVKMPLDATSLEAMGLPNAMIMVSSIIDKELGKVGKATGKQIGQKK